MSKVKQQKNYGIRECIICSKSFSARQSKHSLCSTECVEKHRKKMKQDKKMTFINSYFENKDKSGIHRKLLKKRKLKVSDERVINYDSPTGKGFIGIAKHPLQKVEDGYGYKGVLIQTDNRTLVQCHICAKWFSLLSYHLKKTHEITKEEYCEKFGLNKINSLCSDNYSYQQEAKIRKSWKNNVLRKINLERLKENHKEAIQKALASNAHNKRTVEMENKTGTCEKQLLYRIINYIKQYKDLPSCSKKGEGGKICKVLRNRHGSLNNAFQFLGLPIRHRKGTSVELIAPNGEQYFFNYNKNYSKEEIYLWMEKNCEVLRKINIIEPYE